MIEDEEDLVYVYLEGNGCHAPRLRGHEQQFSPCFKHAHASVEHGTR